MMKLPANIGAISSSSLEAAQTFPRVALLDCPRLRQIFEEGFGRHGKCRRKLDNIFECDISLSTLYTTHVVAMKASALRKLFLGIIKFLPSIFGIGNLPATPVNAGALSVSQFDQSSRHGASNRIAISVIDRGSIR